MKIEDLEIKAKEWLAALNLPNHTNKLLFNRLTQTKYICITEKEMNTLMGMNEIIGCVGDTCYLTPTFLNLDSLRQKLYFLIELLLSYTYYMPHKQNCPTMCLKRQERLTSEQTYSILDTLTSLGILDDSSYPYELGILSQSISNRMDFRDTQISQLKAQLTQVEKNSPTYVELLEQLVFLYEYDGLYSVYDKDWLTQYIPKVTEQKVCMYLKKLIIEEDPTIGTVTQIISSDEVWHGDFIVQSLDGIHRYGIHIWEFSPARAVFYDIKNQRFLDKRSKRYKQFKEELKVLKALGSGF